MEAQKEESPMKYDLTYEGSKEILWDLINSFNKRDPFTTGQDLENSYLSEFNENRLAEAERLNVLLPIFEWEIDNNTLTPELKDELYLYYEDLMEGRLDGILGEDEADVVIDVLTKCYFRVFDKYPDDD
ncbi:MAG: hypothetical protein IIZ19_10225 [Clostridia bacterium]|nr:hypothetical protein [Clostridia bacterium]MBQ1436258.1 hypothetical protein [Clostridia bacterium]